MKVVETVGRLSAELEGVERPLGLVPTMGYLHAGHMALVERARAENASMAATIFVNPAQFGVSEDLASYPRDMEADLSKLAEAGTDLVFTPSTAEVYPSGFDTHVDIGRVGERLEGSARPGHFQGVATVVTKLLAMFRPDRAYFGQKDAQQCLAVKRLNVDLNLGAEIVVVPTVREPDGLALSSRNAYLSDDERLAATVLYRSLRLADELRGEGADPARIRSQMQELIDDEPLAEVEYVSVADPDSLDELETVQGPALVSLAVRIGRTRLIDNMTI